MRYKMAAVAAVSTAVAGLGVATAGTASAAVLGTAFPSIASGSTSDTWAVRISNACPAPTSKIKAELSNAAAGWNDVPLTANQGIGLSDPVSDGVQLSDSLVGIASANGLTLANGNYLIRATCTSGLSTVEGTFEGTIAISGTSFSYAAPATSTSLAVTPPSPAAAGTSATLTATVTPATAGTVQFKDGATVLGSSPVSGGTASLTTGALSSTTHSFTAAFTPADPLTAAGSVSAATSYTVKNAVGSTTTTLATSPVAPTTADVVALSATVSPGTATGSVTFTDTDSSSVVGTAPVSSGLAAVSLSGLSAGAHHYKASFVPSDPDAFTGSVSSVQTVDVAVFSGVSTSEIVTTSVPAGALTITAAPGTVDLGTPVLDSTGTLLVTSPKDLSPVTVTDTRPGLNNYTVNGVAPDFTKSGTSDKINSENLGWTPKLIGAAPGGVSAGPAVAAGQGIAVGATTGAGLKTARTLGQAVSPTSLGSATFGADLVLKAPVSTKPGTYTTTLTITAI